MLINEEAYLAAIKYNGLKEISGEADNPIILLAHQCTTLRAPDDETAWCSSATNLAMVLANIRRNPVKTKELLTKRGIQVSIQIALFKEAGVDYYGTTTIKSQDNIIVEPTWSARARSWLDWGYSTKANPQEGDICIFSRGKNKSQGHVAFFKRTWVAGTFIEVFGGNQNNSWCFANYASYRLLDIRRGRF